jgi:hypothetical protein
MNKQFLHMQKLAGLITESELKQKLNEDESTNKITIRATGGGFTTFMTGYEISVMGGSSKDRIQLYFNEDDISEGVPEDIVTKLNELGIPFYIFDNDEEKLISSTEFGNINDMLDQVDFMFSDIEVEKKYCKVSPTYQDAFRNF